MKKNKPAFRDFQRKLTGEPKYPLGLMSIYDLYERGYIQDGDKYYIFNLSGSWSGTTAQAVFSEREVENRSYIKNPWFTTDPEYKLEGFYCKWQYQ